MFKFGKRLVKSNLSCTRLGAVAFSTNHPKINPPIFKPAPPKPLAQGTSFAMEGHSVDGKALLKQHIAKQWTREEVVQTLSDNALNSWVASNKPPVPVSHGEGIYLYDMNGKKYIDFNSQAMCSNLGHTTPPQVIEAVTKQMQEVAMTYAVEFSPPVRAKLIDLMKNIFPGDLNSFFFTCGGNEANEAAIRMARMYTKRPKVLARYRSYHGSTNTTLRLTGDPRRHFAESAGAEHIVHFHDPWPYSFKWGETEQEVTANNLRYLEETIVYENPSSIAAIILETVTGTNGILKAPKGYLEGVRSLCDKYGIQMIGDEVMAGWGRTGKWFGFMHTDPMVIPDIVTSAKGVNAALLPMGCVAVRDHLKEYFDSNAIGTGTTYNAHPTVLASAYAVLKLMLEQDIVGHVGRMEAVVQAEMDKLAKKYKSVSQCRSLGLFSIVELQRNSQGELWSEYGTMAPEMVQLKESLLEKGLFTMLRPNGIMANPPLNITEEEIKMCFGIIDEAIGEVIEPAFQA